MQKDLSGDRRIRFTWLVTISGSCTRWSPGSWSLLSPTVHTPTVASGAMALTQHGKIQWSFIIKASQSNMKLRYKTVQRACHSKLTCSGMYSPSASHCGTNAPTTGEASDVACALSLWFSQWVLGRSGSSGKPCEEHTDRQISSCESGWYGLKLSWIHY